MGNEDILNLVAFVPDEKRQHVHILDQCKCQHCKNKDCLVVCPSWVFRPSVTEDTVMVLYKQCIECGACRLICSEANIAFSYPVGGFGVVFQEG